MVDEQGERERRHRLAHTRVVAEYGHHLPPDVQNHCGARRNGKSCLFNEEGEAKCGRTEKWDKYMNCSREKLTAYCSQ